MPTEDVAALVRFYEQLTGTTAEWANPEFAEIVIPGATIAISSPRLTDAFAAGSVTPGSNATMMLELLVDDVDAEREKLRALVDELVMEPTTLPWGNRSLLLRDPDGNVVNLFTPVTPEAQAKFGAR
jgi:uncharacterized glyoxalase superfamily protein PhnB